MSGENRERYQVISILFVVGCLVLLINLLVLQVFNRTYSTEARDRTLTKRSIIPPRGIIYDRNKRLLVVNEPAYELEVIFNELSENMDIEEFCSLLEIDQSTYESTMSEIQSASYFRRSLPFRFVSNIDPELFASFQEHLHKFPGFYPIIKNKRGYPFPHAAHALGFIGEVNNEDLKKPGSSFDIGDYKGIIGMEKTYDSYLRGEKGLEFLLKDNIGREIEPFQSGSLDTMAQKGEDIVSSLDIDLQAYGEKLLSNKRGSIVAIEPSSGEILALMSSPAYDPNLLSLGRQRNITYLELLRDTVNQPFFDRSVQAKYPPGSIFKPVLSLIALQEKTTYARRAMVCSGEYVINERRGFVQGCRNHPTPRDLETALQYSCNSYYFQIIREFIDQFGIRTPEKGLDLLGEYLNQFGLGHPLGVDLTNESGGFIPTSSFYNNIYKPQGSDWRSTYILSLGIGQGELELTTVQMANLAAIIANRGFYYIPHLLKAFSSENLPDVYQVKKTVSIDSMHFDPVINGMEKVISEGTGRRAFVPGISICGKTGTSQNPHGVDHSVFFGFAPKEDPKIALAVYVENAGGGSTFAAPIGGLMIEKYLNKDINKNRIMVEERIKNINLIDNP